MGQRIKKYFIVFINCLILSLSGNFAYSQSIVLGKVTDTLQNPIPFANVIVKAHNQEAIIAYTTTEENGHFQFSIDKEGSHEVTASSISFQKKTEILFLERNQNYKLDFILKEEIFTLDEVILHSERAITVKKDTIIFRADAFKRGNEETVEDLLKNIPGIDIASDGKIKIGGKEIEKVMVEGDDLFEKGYALLTKNLDASVIDKVEVYEKYSNNRLLKGIEDSDRVALNLTLKENVKNKVFGSLKPGYGLASENRYDASANIISFRKKNKFYGFANFNNVGIEATAALSEMMDSGENNFGNIGNDGTASPFIKLINYKPDVGEERTNFNNAEMGAFSDIYSISPKTKLKTVGFLNWDENDFFRKSRDTYFLPSGDFTTAEDYKLYGKTFSGFAHTQLTYDISKTEMFEYSGKYSGNRSETNTSLLFNNDFSNEYLDENPFSVNQRLKYTNKIKANQVLILKGYYLHSANPQKYKNSRFLFEDLFQNDNETTGVSQNSNNTLNTMGFDAGLFTRRTNNDLWEAKIGLDYADNHHVSELGLMGIDEKPEGFQNDSKYKQLNVFFEPSYRLKMGSFAFTGNIRFVQNFTDLTNEDNTLDSSPFFINPKITADWELNKNHRVISFFKYEKKNPSLKNVQNGYVLNQYNRFSKGLENIEPLESSTFFLNYTLGNILSTFYANTSFIYVRDFDYLGSKAVITPDYTLNELIRLKNKEFFSFQTEPNIYIGSISQNLKIKLGYNKQNFENSVNGDLRTVTASTFNYGLEVRSAFIGPFNFHIGTEWFNSSYKTTLKQESTRNLSFLDIVYEPIKNLNFSLNSSRYYFSDLDRDNDTYYFMDFEAKYQVIKNRLSMSVVGKNLLNTRTFRNVNISDTGIFTSEYRLLPRFFLLKANIRF